MRKVIPISNEYNISAKNWNKTINSLQKEGNGKKNKGNCFKLP
jgi:hypothetical protein